MRLIKSLLLLVVILAAGAAYVFQTRVVAPLPLSAQAIEFTIPAGSGLNAAADIIAQAGAGLPAWQLALLGRAMGRATQIKAGSYEVRRGTNAVQLIDMLTRGDVLLAKLTIVEGKTWAEIRAQLNAHPDLEHTTSAWSDAQVIAALGLTTASLEGWLLPETYLFDKRSSDLDLLRRAHDGMAKALAQAWSARDPSLGLATQEELLTLASMIEKETGQAADRPAIASVFVNRLRVGMPMQSDPTVIYGLGIRFDGNLRRVDLQTDTPWNTYTRGGLPPTPICMPGLKALEAASHPPHTTHLYFVARGDGSSAFSATLDEHNRAVARYQKRNSQ